MYRGKDVDFLDCCCLAAALLLNRSLHTLPGPFSSSFFKEIDTYAVFLPRLARSVVANLVKECIELRQQLLTLLAGHCEKLVPSDATGLRPRLPSARNSAGSDSVRNKL